MGRLTTAPKNYLEYHLTSVAHYVIMGIMKERGTHMKDTTAILVIWVPSPYGNKRYSVNAANEIWLQKDFNPGWGDAAHYEKALREYQAQRENEGPSGKWMLKGFCRILPGGRVSDWPISVQEYLALSEEERYYKNGKSRYAILDVDHGTTRMWGGNSFNEFCVVKP